MARSSETEGRSATRDGESVHADLEFSTISTPDLGLLQSFLALMPDAAVVVDAGGLIVSANEQALSLFGYAFDDLVGRRVESLLPERFRHHHRQYRTDYTRSPQTRPMGAGQDLTGRRKDGGEFPVDISLAPLSVGEGTLIVAAIRDATERRAATSAMAHLAAIVESSTDAIASMTVDGIVTSWNPGAVRLFGYTTAEIMGRHLSILAPEEGSAEFEHLLAIALEGERTTPLDTRWRKRDGELLDVELSVSPVHDARGQLLGFSAVLRDITERKLVENELRRLLKWERQRERQHAATSEIRLALLSGRPMSEVLGLISRRATDLLHAQSSAVTLTQSDQLRVLAASGTGGYLVGTALTIEDSLAGRVVTTGDSIRTESTDVEADLDLRQLQSIATGPAIGVPVVFEGSVRGALTVLRAPGSPAFSAEDLVVAEGLAAQASLGLQLGRAREDRERLLITSDRERIARDLHDLAIQRLFASGMALEGLVTLSSDPRLAGRISEIVEGLDATIREIRTTVFELGRPSDAPAGVRARVLELSHEATHQLGFEPIVTFEGPVDTTVSDEVIPHLAAVVREALANAARHSRASQVQVEVSVGDELVLLVIDNGIGFHPHGRTSGIANLRQRAELLGGSLQVEIPDGGGTRLRWNVPLDA